MNNYVVVVFCRTRHWLEVQRSTLWKRTEMVRFLVLENNLILNTS